MEESSVKPQIFFTINTLYRKKAIVCKCVYCMCALHFNLKQTFLTHVKSFSIVCVINVGVKTTGMEHNLHILKLVEEESPQF